jgi:ABC-type proline/glycine betaine transport system substrate-binding protein
MIALFAAGFTVLMAGCGATSERTVIFADPGWDSVRFHNAVAQLIAEKVYGLKTETLYGSTPIMQAALLRGDVDVHMELWTDNVPTYEADKAAGGIIDLSVNYNDNRQGFYVPRYVIEGDPKRGIAPMAPDLKTVKDLARYAALFKDEENPERGRIYGAIPGWSIDEILYKKYKAYGLDKNYVYFRPGSEATLNTAFLTAYEKGLPIVGYQWEPTWLSGKLDLILLEDEPYEKELFEQGLTAAPSVKVVIAANPRFPSREPEFAAFLKRYHSSSALTAEALAYMADHKASYKETAQWFLKNHGELVKTWLSPEEAEKLNHAL